MNYLYDEQREYALTQHNVAKFIMMSENITLDSTVGELMNVKELNEQLWDKVKDSSTFTGEDNELRKLFAIYHKKWEDKWQRGEFFSSAELFEPDYWDMFAKQSNDRVADLCLKSLMLSTAELAMDKDVAKLIDDLNSILTMIRKVSQPQSKFKEESEE